MKQRRGTEGSADQAAGSRFSRRAFLGAVGGAGLAGIAGYGLYQGGESTAPVSILAAGSLQHALETELRPAVDVPVHIECHGSMTVARLVAEGQRDPDIVVVADPAVFEETLPVPWHVVFASNAVVLAYDANSPGGRRIEAAGPDRWYEPLLAGSVDLGRVDPDLGPLGYRTLFALELATRLYDDASDLRERIPQRKQTYPATGLVGQFETGGLDAAFAYRNMAVERGYDFLTLPDRINLSDPDHVEEWYSTTTYQLPSGQVVRGGLIGYGATLRSDRAASLAVFDALTSGSSLQGSGFLFRDRFPTVTGEVPDRVRRVLGSGVGRSPDRTDTAEQTN
ncbi:extracellular solute-binding protein [Halorhabdus salina]|uniref:extracellular solute-binding protein n=1 Tax=Halorhabdus salina TaxID=2750670 RepID=UPI001C666424|nr:extracellular solute-binding protein [Halorhabdus salina]